MSLMAFLLMQLLWAALATMPAALGAVLFARYSAGSARLKAWVCRLALISSILVLLAIGVQVEPVLRHERPTGDMVTVVFFVFLALTAAWLGGAGRRVARLARARQGVREMCACATPLPEALEQDLRRTVECPDHVEMRASDFVTTVVIVYGDEPMIIIPTRFLFDPDLAIAVSHELAHLRHGDAGWNLVYECVATVLWFSPAILRLGDGLRISQEVAADAAAMKRHECDRGRYGKMLLRFADVEIAASPFVAALGAKGDMVTRLEALKPRSFWPRVVSGLLAVLVLALMIPLRSGDAPPVMRHLHHTLRDMHH